MVGATGEAKGPPPSAARGRRRIKLAVALGGALAAAAASAAGQAARAQGDEVDIRVLNRSWRAIVVRVHDLVCRRVVFEGEILSNASVLVPGCPGEDGLVAITVVDRSGHRRTYPGLTGSSTVEVEFR